MLRAQLFVEARLEAEEGGVGAAGDGHGTGLVAAGVDLDLMLERVVVDVVCGSSAFFCPGDRGHPLRTGRMTRGGGAEGEGRGNARMLHSGTDSCSSFWPNFIGVYGKTSRALGCRAKVWTETDASSFSRAVAWRIYVGWVRQWRDPLKRLRCQTKERSLRA